MKERPRALSASNSAARVLLVVLCAGSVTLSVAAPVALAVPDRDDVTPPSDRSLQSLSQVESANATTDLPPGTSEHGIDNVTRLTGAHRSVLEDSTYAARADWDHVSGLADRRFAGFDVEPVTVTVTSGPDSSLVRFVGENVVNE